MILKNQLAQLREKKSMSQTELAAKLQVSQQTISKWESGSSVPKPYQMSFLEDLFDVSKEQIFFESFNYKMKLKLR